MKKFKYKAMKNDGTKTTGEYEANSRDDVMEMITSNGYYPLKVEEVIESATINIHKKIKVKEISIFCRQMYTMLDAGVPLINALNLMSTQVTNKHLVEIVKELEEDVRKGEMLSNSMRKFPEAFPTLLTSMVESGEASGNLDEMFLRMSTHFEKENKINNKVKAAMIYPIILAIVGVAALIVVMVFVMPTFVSLFDSSGAELPAATRLLIGLSSFMGNHYLMVIGILIAVVVGIIMYSKTESGIYFFAKLKISFPLIKDLNRKMIVSRFTRTLSTLLASGVSLVESLPIVSAVLNNVIAEDEVLKIRERVVKGEGLSTPIEDCELFPPMLSSMVRIGEESGALDDMLNKTADFYDEEVEQAIQTLTSMLEPIMIIIMGLVIGFMVIALMLPLYGSYDLV
ncbi:MAG: type II secretion system F family protein [Clostridium sp.]|jgi:type IV pilus assembly protein PilC|nr:type II secretion system F family protein [Clostridium sp.]